jgi:NhaP-type Na+/H+ or K+/H+ antiporter
MPYVLGIVVLLMVVLVLFVDATEVPGSILAREHSVLTRLLVIALPISLLLAWLAGWMGPRGLASLVFGLLAVIELAGTPSSLTAQVMVITALLSVILHDLSAGPIGAAFARAGR